MAQPHCPITIFCHFLSSEVIGEILSPDLRILSWVFLPMWYHSTTSLSSFKHFFAPFSHIVQVTGFEPSILGLWVEFVTREQPHFHSNPFCHFLSLRAISENQILNLRIMSWLLYHCANVAQPHCLTTIFYHFLSPGAIGEIQSPDLRILSWVLIPMWHHGTDSLSSFKHFFAPFSHIVQVTGF